VKNHNAYMLHAGLHGLNILLVSCVSGLPVTIRLLDPPLHEFLPEGNIEDIVSELCAETGANQEDALARIEKLSEVNPMLGFRGCRLEFCYYIHSKKKKKNHW
jgi:phosphoenolpyruvate synthase/pyruvate phosphate dikinase